MFANEPRDRIRWKSFASAKISGRISIFWYPQVPLVQEINMNYYFKMNENKDTKYTKTQKFTDYRKKTTKQKRQKTAFYNVSFYRLSYRLWFSFPIVIK